MRERKKIREVIVVEGRYDQNALSQVVDALIIKLDGFAAFRDREKIIFLRRLAEERGLVILTDSDGAGFVLRGWLKSVLPGEKIKHAYIPDIKGKERRKNKPGKEGKIGVEGMRPEILLESLRRAGVTWLDSDNHENHENHEPEIININNINKNKTASAGTPVTKADLYAWGLSGGKDSAEKRRKLLLKLSLPERMNANAMLDALNILYPREELEMIINELNNNNFNII